MILNWPVIAVNSAGPAHGGALLPGDENSDHLGCKSECFRLQGRWVRTSYGLARRHGDLWSTGAEYIRFPVCGQVFSCFFCMAYGEVGRSGCVSAVGCIEVI